MNYRCITLVLILLLGLVPFVALKGQTAEITEIGSFYSGYGNVQAYQSSGDYAYVLFNDYRHSAYNLLVFSLDGSSVPETECMISLPMPDYYRTLALEGQRLVVASDRYLLLYDISNPIDPVLSVSQTCQGVMSGAILMGDYLITLQDAYLRAYNLITPGSISLTDSMYVGDTNSLYQLNIDTVVTNGNPHKVVHLTDSGTFDEPQALNLTSSLAGTWHNLVFTRSEGAACMYDVSDLQNPVLLHEIYPNGPYLIYSVYVLDGYLVMSFVYESYHYTMVWSEVYDIHGTQPIMLADDDIMITDTYFSDGSNRILKRTNGKISFIEVSETPVYEADLINSNMYSISAGDDAVYAEIVNGVQVLDPTSPTINLGVVEVDCTSKVAACGSLLVSSSFSRNSDYEVLLPNTIHLWDASNPTAPILQSSFILEGLAQYQCTRDIRFDGDIMLLLGENGIVSLYNISNPEAPVSLGLIEGTYSSVAADLSGSYIYLTDSAGSHSTLYVYQINEVEAPVLLANLNLTSSVHKLDVVGPKLYVSTPECVLVYDLTNPTNPILLSSAGQGLTLDFAIQDNALVVLGESILQIYGITATGFTELVASHEVPSRPTNLAICGNTVFVLDYNWLIYLDCTAAFNAIVSNEDHTTPSPVIRLSTYPNPFSGATTLSFDLKSPERVQMSIYNIRGQKLVDIMDTSLASGSHQIAWDGKDASGKTVSTGIYFCRLKAGGKEVISRMAVVH